jgi:hypothetical protein
VRLLGPAPAPKGCSRAQHRLRWVRDIVDYATNFVALPDPDIPALDLPSNPIMLSDNEIEQAAEDIRRYWRMSEGPSRT